ncbi:probable 28S rRNA (cytosine(4447)-C(5))-methyltransferase [Wyeomyia smithii]|uniref:probable 28S rRNA (cytosine(4447)-C(5))-methyltransferase n=1 Tax=Wyeomyia smithii TaxID=174621 RepID=UPI002468116F|nr:probable 28S rRNA (cytosine(4447)-C(5))-methyltransferase [Wyeomyia smithii]
MGRKINFAEKIKKGPGKKSRKQKDPVFLNNLKDQTEPKKFSRKQKARAAKRELLKTKKNILKNELQSNVSKEKKIGDKDDKFSKKNNHTISTEIDYGKSKEKYSKLVEKNSMKQKKSDLLDSDDSVDVTANNNKSNIKSFLGSDDSESNYTSSDEEAMLPIERAGKKLKRRKEKDERLADEEMFDIAANNEKFEFPNDDTALTNLQSVNLRIKDVIGVLTDFASNRDPNHSRAEYIDLLCKDLCVYYSYNDFLMQLLVKLFAPNQLLEFLEASEIQRPLTVRTNSLKIRRRDLAQAMINRGVNLDPLGKWTKEGLVVYSSQVPLGATPEYLAGYYMIQGASSMLPVISLAPEENERILDLCAAPGGKSSHIAALMKNTGVLFANDINKERLQAVVGNFHRLGIQNAIVTNIDGTKYNQVMTGFDRVLLDAPCSGSGVISKDPSVKTTKTEIDIQRCYNLQRKLLLSAIDCLSANSNTGGYLVYSTCSILPQENEWVIDYALRKRNVRLVSTGLDIGTEGFVNFAGQKYHPTMRLTRRFYPHTYNMDGFFVAKLQKFSDAITACNNDNDYENTSSNEEQTFENLPKKIDKRDWFYKDVIEKRKQLRKDTNHVVKIFEKPAKNKATVNQVSFDNAIKENELDNVKEHFSKKKDDKKIKKVKKNLVLLKHFLSE